MLYSRPTFMAVGDIDAQTLARQLELGVLGLARRRQRAGGRRAGSGPQSDGLTIYVVDKPGAAQSVIPRALVT